MASKASLVGTSVNDVQFNTLKESGDSKDLTVSSFSTDKMNESAKNGKNYVSTSTYLQQIEDKYERQYKKR